MDMLLTPQITKIESDSPVFGSLDWAPSSVNCIFGENGTGKTTLANAICEGKGLSWEEGFSASDVEVLRYDQHYVSLFFNRENRIPGIFSTQGINKEIASKIRALETLISANKVRAAEFDRLFMELNEAEAEAFKLLKLTCWKNAAAFRKTYSLALRGSLSNSEKFAGKILSVVPSHDGSADDKLQILQKLYASAYEKEASPYEALAVPDQLFHCLDIPGQELLRQPFSAGGNTGFSGFVHALHAQDWIWEGKEAFLQASEGSCPFCSQKLPDAFSQMLRDLFDENYEAKITSLRAYEAAFKAEANRIYTLLSCWLDNPFPGIKTSRIPALLTELKQLLNTALHTIREKTAHPGNTAVLPDLEGTLTGLKEEARAINRQIEEHNDIIKKQKSFQRECSQLAWQYLADTCTLPVRDYHQAVRKNSEKRENAEKMQRAILAENQRLEEQLRLLESRTENSREAVAAINHILSSSRYQGFSLREKDGADGLYEIVRPDGSLADSLSDGEYRMLTFLYFCQQALKKGGWPYVPDSSESQDTGDIQGPRPRLLVIDDPVNGVDRRGRRIISSMIAHLARVCLKETAGSVGAAGIAQLFWFTHDIAFYDDFMKSWDSLRLPESYNRQVTWGNLRKVNGISTLTLRDSGAERGQR